MNRIDTSQIRKMFDLAEKLSDPINLSIGQPHFPTPEPIREELIRAIRDGKTAYTPTQGILPLRERVSRKFSEVNGFELHPDNILISTGVSSLIQLIFMSFIEPGDRVLLMDPYFLMYRSLLDFFGAEVRTVPENFDGDDLAALDSREFRLIIYCSPSNPTGHVLSGEQIELLAQLAEEHGALLVADEIYELFDYDQQFISAGTIYPRAVTLMGFSKSYSMTGLRLAAAGGPAEIIGALTILQQYTAVCAPTPVQWAGIRALDLDMSDRVREYRRKRDYCAGRLQPLTEFSHPQGAIYIFPRIPGNDVAFAERAIREKQLLIVPGHIFTSATDFVRISYAASDETLERGMDALTDLLKGNP